jgi:hypothetical protein
MLNRIFTGDDSWVHHYQTESKRASMQRKLSNSPSTKKFKVTPSPGKVILAVFEDCQGVRGENVNSAPCCEVLLKLRDAIRKKRPVQLARGVLLHHDNARPRTDRASEERIQELQWELLEHPPYSRGLAPSDSYLFGLLK